MIDLQKKLILKLLTNQCTDGSYKILEKNELISLLPQKYRTTEDELNVIVHLLEQEEFISIKYEDDKVFCLCTLPKTNNFQETKEKDKEKFSFSPYLFFIIIFAISFCSSFLAILIAKLISF